MQIDIPDHLGWVLEEHARNVHVDVADLVTVAIIQSLQMVTNPGESVTAQVERRVRAGECDADIAAALHGTVTWVAGVRRSLGLPANRRYPHREAV